MATQVTDQLYIYLVFPYFAIFHALESKYIGFLQ